MFTSSILCSRPIPYVHIPSRMFKSNLLCSHLISYVHISSCMSTLVITSHKIAQTFDSQQFYNSHFRLYLAVRVLNAILNLKERLEQPKWEYAIEIVKILSCLSVYWRLISFSSLRKWFQTKQ